MSKPDPFAIYDAAYVMGALDAADRVAFEEHLTECAACRAAVRELRPMGDLLAKTPGVPPAAVDQVPPDTVLPRLLRAARQTRRRRRRWAGAAAVAAAAVLVTGTAVVAREAPAAPPGHSVAMSTAAAAPLQATLRVDRKSWGTELSMRCTYLASAGYAGVTYALVVVPKAGGAPQTVARWTAYPGREVRVTGSTNLTLDQIAKVQVKGPGGTVLLQS